MSEQKTTLTTDMQDVYNPRAHLGSLIMSASMVLKVVGFEGPGGELAMGS